MDLTLTREDRDAAGCSPDAAGEAEEARGESFDRAAGARRAARGSVVLIADMAREFGVSERALRLYEDKGLLRPPRRGRTRLYGARERRDLAMILKGKRLGFTLAEIADMLSSSGAAAPGADLALPPERIVAQIGFLERQRRDLDAAILALRQTHLRLLESARCAATA